MDEVNTGGHREEDDDMSNSDGDLTNNYTGSPADISKCLDSISAAFEQARDGAFALGGDIAMEEICIQDVKLYHDRADGIAVKVSLPLKGWDTQPLCEATSAVQRVGKTGVKKDVFGVSLLYRLQQRLCHPFSLRATVNKLLILEKSGGLVGIGPDSGCHERDLLGTLFLSVPSTYTGGQIEIQHGDSTYRFERNRLPGTKRVSAFQWIYMPIGCTAVIRELVQGCKVHAVYNIYQCPSQPAILATCPVPSDMINSQFQGINDLFDKLGEALDEPMEVAFALSDVYIPSPGICRDAQMIRKSLRGVDRLLMDVVEEQGLSWTFRETCSLSGDKWSAHDSAKIDASQELRGRFRRRMLDWVEDEDVRHDQDIGTTSVPHQEWVRRMDAYEQERAERYVQTRDESIRTIREDLQGQIKATWSKPFRQRVLTSRLGVISKYDQAEVKVENEKERGSVIADLTRGGAETRDDILWIVKPDGPEGDEENGSGQDEEGICKGLAIFVTVQPLQSTSEDEEPKSVNESDRDPLDVFDIEESSPEDLKIEEPDTQLPADVLGNPERRDSHLDGLSEKRKAIEPAEGDLPRQLAGWGFAWK